MRFHACSPRKPQLRVKPAFLRRPLYLATASVMALMSHSAHALNWELDNGVTVDLDTTLTYEAQWRMESRDDTLLNNPAPIGLVTDDGNRNFDKHDLTQNRISFSSDLDINYGDGGVFLRARGWYDDVYDDDQLITEKSPVLAPSTPPKTYQQNGLDIHKDDLELLDAFVYHTFDLDPRTLSVRVGRQVVNWGESLFINGGISSAQGPLDATKANSPGVELKDIFLPIGQAYVEADLSDAFSVGAYYQWEWEQTRIDAPGSYFNVLEVFGQGVEGDAVPVFAGLGTRVKRDKPDEGQYGIALRYLAEGLNNTEFGFYRLRFNDFMPTVLFVPPALGTDVTLKHFEDIDLYGMSFGTVIGDTNISGEFNYRDGQPVRIANSAGAFYFSPADTLQTQLSVIHTFGAGSLWDNLTVTGEIGNFRVLDMHQDALASALNGSDLSDEQSAVHGHDSASSAVVRFAADYFSIANGLDLKVTATYRNDFAGVSPMLGGFAEGTEILGVKADFTYLNKHNFGVSYTAYLTDPDQIIRDHGELQLGHFNADRDYLAAYYKYRF